MAVGRLAVCGWHSEGTQLVYLHPPSQPREALGFDIGVLCRRAENEAGDEAGSRTEQSRNTAGSLRTKAETAAELMLEAELEPEQKQVETEAGSRNTDRSESKS